jgi:RNA-binding protein 39
VKKREKKMEKENGDKIKRQKERGKERKGET